MNKEKNNYSVYIHTNKSNGKKYIGITKQNPNRRWQKGYGYENTYFGNAIKKYGWDGFTHEVIISGLDKTTACQMEIALIALHKTNDRDYGYNISEGGQTCDVITGRCGEQHPNHQRVKMIDAKTGEVIRIFGAQAEAARIMGIGRRGITKACQGISATYKGYVWEYADKNYKKKDNNGRGNYDHSKQKKPVIMIDTEGKAHNYPSIKDAANELGVCTAYIQRYLKRANDTSGRRWCYA